MACCTGERIDHARVAEAAAPGQFVRQKHAVLRDFAGDAHQVAFLLELESFLGDGPAVGKLGN